MKKNNNTAILIIYTLISFFILFSTIIINSSSICFNDWAFIMSIISVFQIVFSFLTLLKLKLKSYSLSNLFLLCIALFYWAQVWLLGFFPKYEFSVYHYNMIQIYPEEIYKNTCFILIVVIMGYVIGIILRTIFNISIKKRKSHVSIDTISEYRQLFYVGIIILIFTLPFNLYENYLYITASFAGGYKSIFNININDFVSSIGWISVVGFVIMIYSSKNSTVKKRWLVISILLYSIEMVSGNRGPSVCAILTIVCFYFYSINLKLNLKKSIKIIIFIVIAMLILETVKGFRGYTSKDLTVIYNSFLNIKNSNFLLKTLEEFGSTVAVPSITRIFLDNNSIYLHGWTYVSGLISIFPNFGDVVNNVQNSGTLVTYLRIYGIFGPYQAIGGSFIAELMFNFQYLWWIASIIIGYIVCNIDMGIKENIKKINIAYYVMPVYGILHWTRAYYSQMIRMIFWSWILIYIINWILNRRKD